ncbi:lysophospholipid acyltransferase family protein [Tabrizicola sp.]|uniref:lysophospholipid acyltransferase family protein n=1 Tax=Tabrizicola sp. TaxID=2005166 RepID=UPI001A3961D6|nr:lysophospholipid acyltransferase family protein [Tabrizicola sp.]MBL9073317.1 1-acyl-sn-glycerol-3-phosphate acyltransferase [Tabrizicola sp.]
MTAWQDVPPPPLRVTPLGWLRVLWRGSLIGALTYGGLLVLLLVRLVEWPLFGQARPVTPHITRFVCRTALRILRLPLSVRGRPMTQPGAIVANHSSWLDIFVLNAVQTIYFVAKAEVADWPMIGWLARATGTVFIARKGTEAKKQQDIFESRLQAGHRLLFFPEGTSTDAIRVLPFKSTLFEAFFSPALERSMHIQPVTVVFHAPEGEDRRHYGWWGDMDFAGHLLKMLATPRQGRVEVIFHPEVPVDAFENRKILSQHCERVIRTAHVTAA